VPALGAQMRIVAFITDPTSVREILAHLGEPTRPPMIAPARGPPLWNICHGTQGIQYRSMIVAKGIQHVGAMS
jgi:hypothetical protein